LQSDDIVFMDAVSVQMVDGVEEADFMSDGKTDPYRS
jgi:hypothetical protein